MRGPLALSLDDVRLGDASLVGAKAAVLGTLREAGFPVPPGICITTAAFHLALSSYRERLGALLSTARPVRRPVDDPLSPGCGRPLPEGEAEGRLRPIHLRGGRGGGDLSYDALSDPHQAACAAEAIAALLADLAVPPAVADAVRAALQALGDRPLAVRSSATVEDGDEVSFAGEHATVLGVRGEEAVLEAVLTCWRSFYAPGAVAARAAAGLSGDGEGMAVLVQPMLAAECAVPAVIRTQVATRRIHQGAWVTVDGDTGVVEWEG